MTTAMAPRVLDVMAAAAYLSISPRTVRALIAEGKLPTVHPPAVLRSRERLRRVLIDRADLDRLIDDWKAR